jgi:type II restriction enzyme
VLPTPQGSFPGLEATQNSSTGEAMNLELDVRLGETYKSRSQIARKITEDWGTKNLFCIACPSDLLSTETANTPVRDYTCPRCGAAYQLKSKNGSFGNVVQNSAYHPKMAAIASGRVPHYVFLQYSSASWSVTDLFAIPGHLISAGVIQMRNPLKEGARRAGWVGSNILLGLLPLDAGRANLDYFARFCA